MQGKRFLYNIEESCKEIKNRYRQCGIHLTVSTTTTTTFYLRGLKSLKASVMETEERQTAKPLSSRKIGRYPLKDSTKSQLYSDVNGTKYGAEITKS